MNKATRESILYSRLNTYCNSSSKCCAVMHLVYDSSNRNLWNCEKGCSMYVRYSYANSYANDISTCVAYRLEGLL